MKDGYVRLARVDGIYKFPSQFQLIAAANPVPADTLETKRALASALQEKISTSVKNWGL